MRYAWSGSGFPGFELEAKQGWRRRLYHRKHAMGCLIQGPRTAPLRKAVPIYLLPTPWKIRPRPIMIIYDVSRSSTNRMDIWVFSFFFFFFFGWLGIWSENLLFYSINSVCPIFSRIRGALSLVRPVEYQKILVVERVFQVLAVATSMVARRYGITSRVRVL
jgi:hypothetical protein